MNVCLFTGEMQDKPLIKEEDGVSRCVFFLIINNYRKTKSTQEKAVIKTKIACEAWHTGAEILHNKGYKGAKVTLKCESKNISKKDNRVIFRVNEFEFQCPEGEDE